MDTIKLEIWLYGPLSRYSGAAKSKSHAKMFIGIPPDKRMRDLLELLSLPTEERGITFINGNLSAMPIWTSLSKTVTELLFFTLRVCGLFNTGMVLQ